MARVFRTVFFDFTARFGFAMRAPPRPAFTPAFALELTDAFRFVVPFGFIESPVCA